MDEGFQYYEFHAQSTPFEQLYTSIAGLPPLADLLQYLERIDVLFAVELQNKLGALNAVTPRSTEDQVAALLQDWDKSMLDPLESE